MALATGWQSATSDLWWPYCASGISAPASFEASAASFESCWALRPRHLALGRASRSTPAPPSVEALAHSIPKASSHSIGEVGELISALARKIAEKFRLPTMHDAVPSVDGLSTDLAWWMPVRVWRHSRLYGLRPGRQPERKILFRPAHTRTWAPDASASFRVWNCIFVLIICEWSARIRAWTPRRKASTRATTTGLLSKL